MKNNKLQSGFTLIELIAVMVILGILAAVIVPRISTLTSGAYESNVRSMFGVIKNEVTAQSVKAAMTGGAGGHREKFPTVDNGQDRNYYLKLWVDDYDEALWAEDCLDGATAGMGNTNKSAGGNNQPDVAVFTYQPHGLQAGYGGTTTDKEDIYFIYYMPVTTLKGEANGYDFDGYMMFATQDADLDGTPDAQGAIAEDGTLSITANGETVIADLTFVTQIAVDEG
tara:strand:- start:677 stop:1354 length:678 start_codon:yes stop_codon:yes gene_type:complete